MKDLENRIKYLEEKAGGPNFNERIENIFLSKDYNLLTSYDVSMLKKYLPDKYNLLIVETCKLMQENI